jgi:hypothetical protein
MASASEYHTEGEAGLVSGGEAIEMQTDPHVEVDIHNLQESISLMLQPVMEFCKRRTPPT